MAQAQKESTSEFVPQWAKKAIWYQVFPERFRNGDPGNDPRKEDIRYADPQGLVEHWQVHPWVSDWYKLQAYEQKNGDQELWKHLLRRRYGGDLQGLIDKLDYLEELGITAIYLNPIFASPSLHKYDGESYHHVDPTFGPDPEGDRALIAAEDATNPEKWVWTAADKLALKLIEEVHARGMRIIFDGVFNHMGYNSFAFADVRKNQQESPYASWFTVNKWDDPNTPENEFEYQGWWGHGSLPEFKEDENGLVEGPRNYVFAATRRWMDPMGKGPEFGIDGWRLDVAFCVDHNFWKDWRKLVKSINPEAYLTAEIVDVPEKVKPYLQGDEFDGEMNYNFAFTAIEFFAMPGNLGISPSQFDQELTKLRNLYPKGVAYVCQNLYGSHDVNRIGSHLHNRGIGQFRDWGKYFSISKAAENPEYDPGKPDEQALHLQKLLVMFQMTYVGAPMIYYGDEVGMWGGNDPDNRKPMVWEDLDYEPEATLPDGSVRAQPHTVAVNQELLAHYKKYIALRKNHPALQTGDYQTLLTADEQGVFAFKRWNTSEELIMVFNKSEADQSVTLPVALGKYLDWVSGQSLVFTKEQSAVQVPAQGALILIVQK